MVVTVVVLGLVLVAAATDLARHKIYNWTTYPGILAAWAWNAAGTALLETGWAAAAPLESAGWIGIGESLLGLLLCGFLMLACFVFFRIGGGDVKLMAMLGGFLGVQRGIETLLWTFVLGACLGLIALVWRVGPWQLVARVARHLLWTIRLGRLSPLTPEERAQLQPPLYLAPSAAVAVVIVQFGLV
jgi:prepilin peptidase CpaA